MVEPGPMVIITQRSPGATTPSRSSRSKLNKKLPEPRLPMSRSTPTVCRTSCSVMPTVYLIASMTLRPPEWMSQCCTSRRLSPCRPSRRPTGRCALTPST